MRMKQVDYKKMETAINDFINKVGIEAIKEHRAKKLGKDIDMRFRWDILSGSRYNVCQFYDYLNDDHINMALKRIIDNRKDIVTG